MQEQIIRILQISDSHLFNNSNGTLLGLNTRQSFDAIIQRIGIEAYPVDLIILTGDVSHDGSPASYQYVAESLKEFNCPIYWLPGNHDDVPTMWQAFAKTQLKADKEIKFQNWHLLLLDSTIPGRPSGHLNDEELNKLKHFLQNSNQENLLVILHHQPIPVGSTWLDGVGLKNGQEFVKFIKNSPNLRAVIFGHIHQAFDHTENGMRYIGTPSTCIQFMPKKTDFTLDKLNPGYQYIELSEDGKIKVIVKRLEDFHANIDFSAEGY